MGRFWKPGDEIVFRHVHGGEIRYAAPYRVVEDSAQRTVLFLPHFSVVYSIVDGRLRPQQWDASVLRIIEPEKWYSLLFFWSSDDERTPLQWYANIEVPAKRYAQGFESSDLILGVVISPDGSPVIRKDAEDFEAAVRSGILTEWQATSARNAADEVTAAAESRTGPFSEGWPAWKPDPDIDALLPEDWWLVDGHPHSDREPDWEYYTDDDVLNWSVECVRWSRREVDALSG